MDTPMDTSIELDQITDKYIGERIYKARRIANMSPQQLADAIGETIGIIRSIERGQRVTAIRLLKVARATGQKFTYFLGDEGTTEPNLGTLNFRPRPSGSLLDQLLMGCVGGGDGRIRTAE